MNAEILAGAIDPAELRSMPPTLRGLRAPWESVAARVPGLSAELEGRFRAGHRVSRLQDRFVVGGSMKGGSSSLWVPATEADHGTFVAWRRIEGWKPQDDREGLARLRRFAARFEIEVVVREPGGGAETPPRLGEGYARIERTLAALPPAHLHRPAFRELALGGWGHDGAKASSYVDGTVHLYEFATGGPARTLLGLLVHELGHAQEVSFEEQASARLSTAHRKLATKDVFFGMEYVQSCADRVTYQRLAYSEFVAETYLAYAACGAALRTFIRCQTPGIRDVWQSVYGVFRDAFCGWEYV